MSGGTDAQSRSRRRVRWLFANALICAGVAALPTLIEGTSALARPHASGASFVVTPDHGPTGTTVLLQSVTPCPSGAVFVDVFYRLRTDAGGSAFYSTHAAPDGTWSLSFSADPGAFGTDGPADISVTCTDNAGNVVTYLDHKFDVTTSGHGYWLVTQDAVPAPTMATQSTNVLPFGDAPFFGPYGAPAWSAPLVGMAANPVTGTGYWLVASDGGVASFGDAGFHGSLPGLELAVDDVVAMAATPDGSGYWLVGSDGGVFSFGDAAYHGSLPSVGVVTPTHIVGIAATVDGGGYWLVGADGGVFCFGDAAYYGSLPARGVVPRGFVIGVARTADGGGYWLVASDGGVFAFGDAPFEGSMGGTPIASPIRAMAATPSGHGYWLEGLDGGVFAFGDAPFEGSAAGYRTFVVPVFGGPAGRPAVHFVGIAATPQAPSG